MPIGPLTGATVKQTFHQVFPEDQAQWLYALCAVLYLFAVPLLVLAAAVAVGGDSSRRFWYLGGGVGRVVRNVVAGATSGGGARRVGGPGSRVG